MAGILREFYYSSLKGHVVPTGMMAASIPLPQSSPEEIEREVASLRGLYGLDWPEPCVVFAQIKNNAWLDWFRHLSLGQNPQDTAHSPQIWLYPPSAARIFLVGVPSSSVPQPCVKPLP